MSFPRRQFLRLTAAAAALPAMSHVGWAQSYPTRQVRVIVPFAPGGPPDTAARLLAQRLSESLGKQFYVENLPGGSGNTGGRIGFRIRSWKPERVKARRERCDT